ncbi:MAG TPA: hypothetical protein VGB73_06795 [Pyrinomonadaceae bacterium]|jgi:hypothetical protein
MKSFILIVAAALAGFGLFSPAASSAQSAPKFSSAYTDLKTQCKAVAEGEAEGNDTPLRCEGYGGYEIRIDFSAASSHLRVQPRNGETEDSIHLAAQPLDYDAKRKIEWRLADGKPFALIFRVDKVKEGLDAAEMWRPENKTGESLLVKGLRGYGHIDFEIDAHAPDANAKAREMADRALLKDR